jgi:hypothetical protein
MRAAISRNGGEVFDLNDLEDPAPGAAPKELKEENDDLRPQVKKAHDEVIELTKQLLDLKVSEADRKPEDSDDGARQIVALKRAHQMLQRELAYSPDIRYLASASWHSTGVVLTRNGIRRDHRLPGAPVLVVNLRAVFRRDRAHAWSPCCLRCALFKQLVTSSHHTVETAANKALSPSAMVGCVKIASRSSV